ncbi:hypothetical protein [Rathayibacter sp. AY1A3]|uniref:hypothetical protein n=1 Tax=Rathayibacter sp. AY1A3 TaxID=2080521 RepID=UPI000CE735F7|nr:hypothetical protein [Rathayibacter sp. AY1A3]PPF34392.1 hypothetical protein C5C10_09325 [Rathayibacter sp. AY1A3]
MPSDRTYELRHWAFGDDVRSAAVELLLRTDLANEAHPWVVHDRAWDTWAIDLDTLTEHITGFAAEHRARHLTPSRLAVLSVAAALADDAPIKLRALLPSLEYEHAELVMIALAHSAGYTQFTTTDTAEGIVYPPRPPLAI